MKIMNETASGFVTADCLFCHRNAIRDVHIAMRRDKEIPRRILLSAGAAFGMANLPGFLRGAAPAGFFRSEGGLLEADIQAGESWTSLGGNYAHLFTYNGQAPGPIFEARAGDTVHLRFTNGLAEPTNLHFHGLHVPPTGSGDNVSLEVNPGESFTYRFALPANHPSGTFWYHPHLHGTSARQVFRGLAGLFIVRGELDDIPEIAKATEHFLVLKDWALDRNGEVPEPSLMQKMNGREGSLITIGNAIKPQFPILTGELIRLRILNASASRFYRLKLEEHPLNVIATDGGPLPALNAVSEILLAPGERVEVLIQGNREAGVYRLLNLPYHRGGKGMMGGSSRPGDPEVLATFSYEGRAEFALDLPGSLVAVDPLPAPEGPPRSFVLSEWSMRFLINGRQFDRRRVDTQVRLGTVEDWEIINQGAMDHPFHLHTNSFQVLDADGQPVRAWKDVLLVPARQRRRFRVRFDDFAGKTVYHCHILDHEDLGMMGVIEMTA